MYTQEQIINILKQKENSGIDISVNSSKSVDGFEFVRLTHELQDSFNFHIDFVSKKGNKNIIFTRHRKA